MDVPCNQHIVDIFSPRAHLVRLGTGALLSYYAQMLMLWPERTGTNALNIVNSLIIKNTHP